MAIHYVPFALAPDADRFAGTVSTDRIRVPSAGKVDFLIVEGAGGTGTTAITATAYTAATSGSSSAITSFRYKTATSSAEIHDAGGYTTASTSVTPDAGANKTTLVQFRFDELPDGYPFVALTFTEAVDSAVDGAVIVAIEDGERPGSDSVTYIA